MKKERTYTYNNPCYKSKIQYHMNKVNNLVNCAPAYRDPQLLLRHMESLNHFVKQQANIQITDQHKWESYNKLQS